MSEETETTGEVTTSFETNAVSTEATEVPVEATAEAVAEVVE